jgi:predicted house-cleaning noncanonical NTP pyrophosphatase (MazG superfamily)
MVTRTWNKLVRDRIPEIIRARNQEPVTRFLADEEFIGELRAKLIEEANEALRAASVQDLATELADVLEVLRALGDAVGISFHEIERLRQERMETRGGFSQRVYLIKTHEPREPA